MSNPLFFLFSPVFGDSALSAAEPDVRKETQSKEVHIHTDFGGLFALMTKSGYQNPRAGNLSVPCNSSLMIFNLTDPRLIVVPYENYYYSFFAIFYDVHHSRDLRFHINNQFHLQFESWSCVFFSTLCSPGHSKGASENAGDQNINTILAVFLIPPTINGWGG